MSDWMEPDIHEAEEYIDRKVAPDGEYTLTIKNPPRLKRAAKGTPYLEWFMTHEPGKNFTPVYERTMLSGRGAFRHFQLFNAMGYANDIIKKSFKYRALAPLTEANAREGVGVELMLNGEKFNPVGKKVKAVLRVGKTNTGNDRSEVASFHK